MLSLRRLGYVLLIVLGICSIFVLYNINEKSNGTVRISNKEVPEEELLISRESIDNQNGIRFCVVGNDEKELYKDIYQNVCRVMEDLKVSWDSVDRIRKSDLQDDNLVIVFCDDIVSDYVDLQQLVAFIEKGGKVVFAAGLAEGDRDAYLHPVVGIVEKSVKENYNQYSIKNGFFPLQDEVMHYDGYNASQWMIVRDDAEIFIQDTEKSVPVVYSYPYGDGESLIINATFLSDCACSGVLVAGMGELLDEFVYPIIGTECVFLDNFPIVTYVNDAVCMKLYGRSTESFVRDVVWPVFQGIAVRNEIKYTSSVLSVSGDKEQFPVVSESLFNTIGKSALQYNGEMVYAAECQDADELCLNEDFIQSFQSTFENYEIGALVMVNGQEIPEAVALLGTDIKTVRGKLSADRMENRMAVLDGYNVFPEATNGISLDDGNMFVISSTLAGYGMISHTFDVNRFIVVDEDVASWDIDKKQLDEYERRVFSKTDYLKKVSLSETSNVLKSYTGMKYGWEKNGNTLKIEANRVIKGQPFWLRTKSRIVKAEGAEYEMVSEGYYCVHLNETSAVLIFE